MVLSKVPLVTSKTKTGISPREVQAQKGGAKTIDQRPDPGLEYWNCNIIVTEETIKKTLKRRGFTRKRVTHIADEQDEEHRALYCYHMGRTYFLEQLVFVDESACNRNMLNM
ncbi:hypothetical protein PM082_024889 [Marasmius tenuissimus]|nr:hypothetical protein PM082_024889 [Marasmius tenuissimus]